MRFRKIYIVILVVSISLCFYTCKKTTEKPLTITLKWNKNYKSEQWKDVRTGLIWSLSFLGAELPKNSFDSSITWIDSNKFQIQLNRLGFSNHAETALTVITDSLKHSETYSKNNAIDISEFLLLTLHSSWHYYKITHVPRTLDEFKKQHHFNDYIVFPVTNSTVASHERRLLLKFSTNFLEQAYIAEEGTTSATRNQFEPEVFEVFDFMPNGQLRFAIYNTQGVLIDASPKDLGMAGKPSKCLWCHEIVIQPLFTKNKAVEGYLTPEEFNKRIGQQMVLVDNYRKTLNSEVDFSKTQDHAMAELLYIGYMEPSVDRLASEWSMSVKEIEQLLTKLPSHRSYEFPFLGPQYERHTTYNLSAVNYLKIPFSVREPSNDEPNYFSNEK